MPYLRLAAGLAVLLLLAAVAPVFAHAVPVRSDPPANARLEASPSEVSITFSEPVVPELSRITLLTQSGETVSTGPLVTADSDGRTLAVAVDDLASGAYLVSWQVLSAVDGHTTSGTFSFGVGVDAAAGGATAVTARFSPLSAAARWLTLTGIALLIGLYAFRLFVWRPIYRDETLTDEESALDRRLWHRSLTIGLVGAGLAILGLLLLLVDRLVSGAAGATDVAVWLGTSFGRLWLARLAVASASAGLLFWLRRREPAGTLWPVLADLALALGLAAFTSLSSHSAALQEGRTLATAVDFAHILAAGVWVGGLVYLALALLMARALPPDSRVWLNLSLILNFSVLAATAVGLLILSGGYLAWQHIGSWSALVGTAYGRVLVAKLGLALLAFLLAGVNLLVVRPRLNAAYDDPESPPAATVTRRFRAVAITEAVVALLILVAAGLLSDMQRGKEAPLLADAAGRLETTQTVEGLAVTLVIEPALVGANAFIVQLEEDGRPVAADEVSLRFTFLSQSLGADGGVATPLGEGRYELQGSYISLAGPWQVEAAVRRPGSYDVFAPFRLDAALGGQIRDADAGAGPADRFVRLMTLLGGLATGGLLIALALLWGFVGARAAHRPWQLVPLLSVSLVLLWLGAAQILNFFEREYTPSRFLTNNVPPTAESVAAGQALYQQKCVECHGVYGLGDGSSAAALEVPPANFTSGHTDIHPDGDLYYWIQNGIEGSPMPAFGDELSREQTWHLVNYVRRLSAGAAIANQP
jgi:copper transport protein